MAWHCLPIRDAKYVVMAPSAVRPGSEFDLTVFILKSGYEAEVSAKLQDDEGVAIAHADGTFTKGNVPNQPLLLMSHRETACRDQAFILCDSIRFIILTRETLTVAPNPSNL